MRGWLLLTAAACGAAAPRAAQVTTTQHTELATSADLAIVDIGGALVTFDAERTQILQGGTVVARAMPRGRWTAAAAVAAPSGERWAVGLVDGRAWRVTPRGELEEVGPRLGVHGARIVAIAGTGAGYVLGLEDGLAISSDGRELIRLRGPAAPHVAIAGTRAAAAQDGAVLVYELGTEVVRRFPIADVTELAFVVGPTGPSLVVVADGHVYVERDGKLARIAAPRALRDVAVAGRRIWMLARGALYVHDAVGLARASSSADTATHVHATASDDVWLGHEQRVARVSLDDRAARTWRAEVLPVFERACRGCHRPGGEAGLDLAGVHRWRDHRAAIEAVVEAHEMPPPGTEISEADRARLLAWLASSR